ncbi:MAG TPA: kelch repeat-containing protein, partial [Candidatus Dormibacteraeota bacterium]|nr:kelch repeat-containing protein [Candidatus Dormibacteraeota bacterium]
MRLRGGAGGARVRHAAAGGCVVLVVAGCGAEEGIHAAPPSPTAVCAMSLATPRAVPGSPWSPVSADLPPDFRAQVWVAAGSGGRIYAEGAGRLVTLEPASTFAATADGSLVVVGGPGRAGSTGGASADVDSFSPATASWRSLPSLPSSRFQAAAATGADGRLYVFGGLDQTGQPVATVFALDPAGNAWKEAASLPSPGDDLAVAPVADGRIMVVGGTPAADGATPAAIFDPAHDAWSPTAPLPDGRQSAGAVRGDDGRVYVIGGRDVTGRALATVDVFDPVSGRWATAPSMSTPRVDPGTVRGQDG